jgi:predicted Zn-dependent peptidase
MMLDRTTPPSIRPLGAFSLTRPERQKLKNGIPLNIIRAGSQEVVRFDVLIGAGQWHQTQALQAMFANRMLREGTSSLTSAQIAEKLDYYGAWLELSSSPNCGFITLYSLNKYFPKTLAIIADMLMNPLFPEKELEVVVESNRQQFLVNSTRVEVIARKNFNRALFGEQHPFGRYAEEADYGRLTAEVLREFYRKYYHSGNCTLYVSGKVTPEIERCIEENLGDAPWGETREVSPLQLIDPQPTTEKRVFVEKSDALQSSLKMGCFVMDRLHPDFLKTRAMVTLFGGYFGSRLMSNIREDKGYTYGIGAGIVNCPGSGVMAITTEADNQYIEAIVKEVYHEMDRLCNDLAPQEELEMLKSYMLGDFCRSYEGPFSLSEAWIYVQTADLDDDFFNRQVDSIRSITAEEIRDLAQRYLCKEKLIEVVAGKKV